LVTSLNITGSQTATIRIVRNGEGEKRRGEMKKSPSFK
jgi:hypothetical protein